MKPTTIFFFIMLLGGVACSNSPATQQIKKLIGQEIRFDDNFELIHGDNDHTTKNPLDSDIKIVTYIDSASCTKCALQILLLWNRRLIEVQNDVGFVAVIFPTKKQIIKTALNEMGISYPLMYDTNKNFISQNKLNVLARNRSFLLDKNNRIVIVGEPIMNDKLWQLYISCIKQMRDNDGLIP